MIICPFKKSWAILWNFAHNGNWKTNAFKFRARNTKGYNFLINGSNIEIVDSYKYLGIFFSKTSNFNKAKKHLIDQADKALYFLYTRINNIQLPIDLTLKLFNHTIVPILTYSCQVWGLQ